MSYVSFLGEPGRMEINGYQGVLSGNARAVSFWYQASSGTGIDAQRGSGTICYWGQDPTDSDPANGKQWRIGTRHSPSRIQVNGRGSYMTGSSGVVEDSEWHHVLVNFPGGKFADTRLCVIYVDGVVDSGTVYVDRSTGADNKILTSAGTNVFIGARPTEDGGFAEYFQGDLDSFAIWNTYLSDVSIEHISSSQSADITTITESGSLQVWLKLGEPGDTAGAGGTMQDSSTKNRDASTTENTEIV